MLTCYLYLSVETPPVHSAVSNWNICRALGLCYIPGPPRDREDDGECDTPPGQLPGGQQAGAGGDIRGESQGGQARQDCLVGGGRAGAPPQSGRGWPRSLAVRNTGRRLSVREFTVIYSSTTIITFTTNITFTNSINNHRKSSINSSNITDFALIR